MMRLQKVAGEGLVYAWPALERSLTEDSDLWLGIGRDLPQLKTALFGGQLQLWILIDEENVVHMMSLTQLIFHAEGQALRIVWARGKDIKDGFPNILDLEYWAARIGCRWVEIMGRKGWERPFRKFGYKVALQVLQKDIERGTPQ